jgi:hypothetical protein
MGGDVYETGQSFLRDLCHRFAHGLRPVAAQTTPSDTKPHEATVGEIIVTANKREQSLNSVGLSIQAASGAELTQRGVSSPADLSKLVPGFTFTQSIYSTPVFTLRGIGLYDATFGAPPSVSVYSDQVPRNVPVMSEALDLDIERVEVLKGPQGTLFGQSSTGGAINYIVGKPTKEFHAGFNASYERFDRAELSGYVSGSLADKVQARLAVKAITGGAWQHSVSRPTDRNGATRKFEGRLTVDIQPTDKLKIELMATGVRDKSDPLAPSLPARRSTSIPRPLLRRLRAIPMPWLMRRVMPRSPRPHQPDMMPALPDARLCWWGASPVLIRWQRPARAILGAQVVNDLAKRRMDAGPARPVGQQLLPVLCARRLQSDLQRDADLDHRCGARRAQLQSGSRRHHGLCRQRSAVWQCALVQPGIAPVGQQRRAALDPGRQL